jgi:hypothetical protein
MSHSFYLHFTIFGREIFFAAFFYLLRLMPDPEISEPIGETDFDPSPTLEDDANYQSLADYLAQH